MGFTAPSLRRAIPSFRSFSASSYCKSFSCVCCNEMRSASTVSVNSACFSFQSDYRIVSAVDSHSRNKIDRKKYWQEPTVIFFIEDVPSNGGVWQPTNVGWLVEGT